jgi:hypothetical protein
MVVNSAGALQDTPSDDVIAVQQTSICALAKACVTTQTGLIQISAAGVSTDHASKFFATKARADAAIRASMRDYWIFRPGLVLSRTAYGGTTLLRMVAAVPIIQPIAVPTAKIQTVSVEDVAEAVARVLAGKVPPGTECDLLEDQPHTLEDLVAAYRQWLGFGAARNLFVLREWQVRGVSLGADWLGHLGWRSPLRSTATQVLRDGVVGDAQIWRKLSGHSLKPMAQTFSSMFAGVEDRMFARMALFQPIVILILFLFWLVSGLVGLVSMSSAADVLVSVGWNKNLAVTSVIFWAVIDIGLSVAIIWRETAIRATMGMICVSLIYLGLGTVITPYLWLDPLGPLVKILPSLTLAILARIMLETR